MNGDLLPKIWVIGDSHARVFAFNDNFLPFFIGPGRDFCFITDQCLANVVSKVIHIVKEISAKDAFMLFLGEPDTRYYLGKGWEPWNRKLGLAIRPKEKTLKSFRRYRQLIKSVSDIADKHFYLLNITPSVRARQNALVDYFNSLLQDYCTRLPNVDFISINSEIYAEHTHVIKDEYYGDIVHLNHKLQLLVEAWFIRRGILSKSCFDEGRKFSKKGIRKHYKYNEHFGCYTL